MTFARVKPFDWVVGELLTSEQQNRLDVDHAHAIDGAAGGPYTPSEHLSILPPATKHVVVGGCTFPSVSDGGGVACTGPITSTGDVTCNALYATTTASCDSLTTSALSATGNVVLGEDASRTLTVYSTTDFYSPVVAHGRVRSLKRFVQGGNSGTTYQYSPASYDFIYFPSGLSVDASTIWKISTGYVPMTGSQMGEVISFRNLGSGNAIAIQDQAGVTLATIGPLSDGNLIRVDVGYDQLLSAWVVVDHGYK